MATDKSKLSENVKQNIPKVGNLKIGIIVSEWNNDITSKLLDGALSVFKEQKVPQEDIFVEWVPGSFELPLAAQFMAKYTRVDTVICLGCVIQGETKHFDFICDSVSHSISKVGLDFNIPVIFGVLTTFDMQQAIERAGGKHGNKGTEAAITAIKMIALKKKIKEY